MPASTTYVRSLLEYCTLVWSPHHTGLVNRIDSVQRNFTKKIQGLSHMHYSDRLLTLGLQSLENRRVEFDLIFFYKIFHGLVNVRFDDFFSLANSNTRGHNYKLKNQHSSVNACKFYFSNSVVNCWNCSPYYAVSASSLHTFKRNLSRLPVRVVH